MDPSHFITFRGTFATRESATRRSVVVRVGGNSFTWRENLRSYLILKYALSNTQTRTIDLRVRTDSRSRISPRPIAGGERGSHPDLACDRTSGSCWTVPQQAGIYPPHSKRDISGIRERRIGVSAFVTRTLNGQTDALVECVRASVRSLERLGSRLAPVNVGTAGTTVADRSVYDQRSVSKLRRRRRFDERVLLYHGPIDGDPEAWRVRHRYAPVFDL